MLCVRVCVLLEALPPVFMKYIAWDNDNSLCENEFTKPLLHWQTLIYPVQAL